MNEFKQTAGRRGSSEKPRFRFRVLILALIIAAALLAAESIWYFLSNSALGGMLIRLAVVCVVSLLPFLVLFWRRRSIGRKSFLIKAMALVFGVACSFVVAEVGAILYFATLKNGFEATRLHLAGTPSRDQLFMAQPYLLYVPRPGQFDINYHNEQGYRGRPVPMQRSAGVARVLCLGGSTTYSWSVADPNYAYPAHLEDILEENLPRGVHGVEVINAGIAWGTTAELLTHYHFKFHYFQPDLVIINTGGNDAGFLDLSEHEDEKMYYQPDYSHARTPFRVPQPLSSFGRVVVRSRFVSWLVILLLYGENPSRSAMDRSSDVPPPTQWHSAAESSELAPSLSDSELAFTHNLHTLIDLVEKDNAKVLLVPFRMAPAHEEHPSAEAERRLERVLWEIADQRGLPVAPFPASVISEENWADKYCHLNGNGCREKAQHLAPFVRPLLWPSENKM